MVMFEDIFSCHKEGVLLACSRQRPEMLRTALTTQNCQLPKSVSAQVGKPDKQQALGK